MRLVLIIAGFALFCSNYAICEYLHGNNLDNWDLQRHFNYGLVIAIFVGAIMVRPGGTWSNVKLEPWVHLSASVVFWGALMSNLMDRAANDYDFHWYDIFWLVAAFYGGCRPLLPNFHRVVGEFFVGKKLYSVFCSESKTTSFTKPHK